MPGIVVDGQDVDVVNATRQRGASSGRARGGGPSLLEMKTYRYRGHSRSDPAKYRPDGELERLEGARPHRASWARKLAAEGMLSTARAGRASAPRLQADVDAAAERAASRPYPTLEETRQYVYAD